MRLKVFEPKKVAYVERTLEKARFEYFMHLIQQVSNLVFMMSDQFQQFVLI